MTNQFTKFVRVKDVRTVAYTTRNLERELLERLRLVCTMKKPQWTLEYGFNEALRIGLERLEKSV